MNFRSIRIPLFFLLAFIIAFTVIAGTTAVSWFVRKPLRDNVINSLERSSQIIQSLLTERKERMRDQAKLVGELPILTTVIESANKATILDSAKTYQRDLELKIFDVVNDVGRLLASVEGIDQVISPQGKEIISRVIAGEKVLDSFGLRNGRLALLASAVMGISDEPSGALLVGMYLDDKFSQEVKNLANTEITFYTAENISGTSLTENEKNRYTQKLRKHVAEVADTNGHWSTNMLLVDTGDDLIELKPITDLSGATIGFVAIQMSLAEAHAVLAGIRNLLIYVGISVFFIAIFGGIFFVSRVVVDPIQSLKKSAGQLAEGHLDAEIDVHRADELGSLAKSFSEMRDAIKKNIDTLNILNVAYERFVPAEFLAFLDKKNIIEVNLGDSVRKNFSILFSDIRAFTTLSESMSPTDVFRFLNSYLMRMGPVVKDHRGFIDKFIGDAIMALFGHDIDDAVLAGIKMLNILKAWNIERERAGFLPIHIGIGINSGEVMLGTLGSPSRMEGSVISDAVNLASRIEGLTKQYGCQLLIGEGTYDNLKDASRYQIRLIDKVKVKGKNNATAIYEIFDADEDSVKAIKLTTKTDFEKAAHLFHDMQFLESRPIFEKCLTAFPEDKATQSYLERIARFEKFGVDEHWNARTEK